MCGVVIFVLVRVPFDVNFYVLDSEGVVYVVGAFLEVSPWYKKEEEINLGKIYNYLLSWGTNFSSGAKAM